MSKQFYDKKNIHLCIKLGNNQMMVRFQVCQVRALHTRFAVPRKFKQTVVFTDGSTITRATTSPRSTVRLTRDQLTNPIWAGKSKKIGEEEEHEQTGQLARFKERYQKQEQKFAISNNTTTTTTTTSSSSSSSTTETSATTETTETTTKPSAGDPYADLLQDESIQGLSFRPEQLVSKKRSKKK